MLDPDLDEFLGSQLQCKLIKVLSEFGEDDTRKLLKALAHPAVSNVSIAQFCTARGKRVSDQTVLRHRKADCVCYKESE